MKTLLIIFSSAIFCVSSVCFAQSNVYEGCANLLNDCFSSEGTQRATCFFSASQHPFCEGTELGKLAHERWSYDPQKVPGVPEGTPSLLGPQLVDKECLRSFDNSFFAVLLAEDMQTSSFNRLQSDLSACTKETSNTLPRL